MVNKFSSGPVLLTSSSPHFNFSTSMWESQLESLTRANFHARTIPPHQCQPLLSNRFCSEGLRAANFHLCTSVCWWWNSAKNIHVRSSKAETCDANYLLEFAEYTTLRSWVKQWLNYVQWYYTVAVAPGVTIQDLLDAPFVNRKWQMESTDNKLVRRV